jgi:ribosome-associated toxin RatA of RatAB toxin-antitoxin module
MKTSDSINIRGRYERIFELAAAVEEWGEILPHYRYVRIIKGDKTRRLVRMSAWRDLIPVTWSAVETIYHGTEQNPGRITFHHVRGLVKGMDVEWSFRPDGGKGDVMVTISHTLEYPTFPVRLLGKRLTEAIVGRGFIGNIAGKTLRYVKMLAEAEEGM